MHTGTGQVVELILQNGFTHVRISCPESLIPAPGQYLLAGSASTDPLPVTLFYTDFSSEGFLSASTLPAGWHPGQKIYLRGPLGHGFVLPLSARKVALVAFDHSLVRLYGLISQALKQAAAVGLVCDMEVEGLPHDVEVQPLSVLDEVIQWADYIAFEVERESLSGLRQRLSGQDQLSLKNEAQIFIHTPVPCGGIADCGVCSVVLKSGWKLACKDGPVFDWREI